MPAVGKTTMYCLWAGAMGARFEKVCSTSGGSEGRLVVKGVHRRSSISKKSKRVEKTKGGGGKRVHGKRVD